MRPTYSIDSPRPSPIKPSSLHRVPRCTYLCICNHPPYAYSRARISHPYIQPIANAILRECPASQGGGSDDRLPVSASGHVRSYRRHRPVLSQAARRSARRSFSEGDLPERGLLFGDLHPAITVRVARVAPVAICARDSPPRRLGRRRTARLPLEVPSHDVDLLFWQERCRVESLEQLRVQIRDRRFGRVGS